MEEGFNLVVVLSNAWSIGQLKGDVQVIVKTAEFYSRV
ncbi:hypothetical protein OROGR_009913 [Orobanche gracilis]